MNPKLTNLSLPISEQEYRELPYLSYSKLATFEKGGFAVIDKLDEKQESPSITFGSMVDTLITEGYTVFDRKFAVVDVTPTPAIISVVEYLLREHKDVTSLTDITDEDVLLAANTLEFYPKFKDVTRVEKLRKEGSEYFEQLRKSQGKTIVDRETYNLAIDAYKALKSSEYTKMYFEEDNPWENIERYYQCKFMVELDGITFKFMTDLILVNHNTKEIIPIDLKTSSAFEYEFPRKYVENHYDIQSRLYWRGLEKILKKDETFKDYVLRDFRFIVVNKFRLKPLVWVDSLCSVFGDKKITSSKGYQILFRDPITIAKELTKYLTTKSEYPEGIAETNSIQNWLLK